MDNKIILHLPIKTVSESNDHSHWTVKHKRHKNQQILLKLALNKPKEDIKLPCEIKLTRISSRLLDDDNLRGAFKHIRDYIADILIPGQKIGRADGDDRIAWLYDQEKGSPQSIRIEIMNLEAA